MLRRVVRLAVATFVVAAAGVVAPGGAQAATCSSASGVSVVVDFHQLKAGGAQSACDAGGAGKYAGAQFEDVGYTLTYVHNQAFVCQVNGVPDTACVRTPPANAYWSLWWSDGKSGTWKYSSLGVASLKVPRGGSVALSWQGQSSQAKPRIAPPTPNASSNPTSSPTSSSSSHPSTGPGQSTTSSSPGPTSPTIGPSSASPGRTSSSKHGHVDPSQAGKGQGKKTIGPDETQAGEPVGQVASGGGADSAGSDSGGLPGWVAPLAVVALFAGAGTIALVRRKSSGGA